MKLFIKKALTIIVLLVSILNTQNIDEITRQDTYIAILGEIELPYKW